jgi:predicted AAA+ superfamily ATPase
LLKKSFEAFARFGGYPICHKLRESSLLDRFDLRDQIQAMVVDRTILHDLKAGPKGTHRNSETVKSVLRQVCRFAGQAVAPKTLLKELNKLGHDSISQQAVSDAISFLADSLLIAEIPTFEGIGKKASHPAKLCLCDHFVREAWLQEQVPLAADDLKNATEAVVTQSGHLAESLVGAFFAGVPGLDVSWFPENSSEGEVDFVLTIGLKRIPVEVKFRRHLDAEDFHAVRSFVSQPKYDAPFGIVVTRETAGEKDNLFCVPLHALLGLR